MFDSDTLAHRGFTVAPALIGPEECRALAALWPDQQHFRKHIVMQRHGYGQGEYQYFTYPLPQPVERLRQALYPGLAAVLHDEGRVVVPAHVGQGLRDRLSHADEPLLLPVCLDRDVRHGGKPFG